MTSDENTGKLKKDLDDTKFALAEVRASLHKATVLRSDLRGLMQLSGAREGAELPAELGWARQRSARNGPIGGMLSLVVPGVFLGNRQAAADRDLLRKHRIVAVVCVGARPVHSDVVYRHISVLDDGSQSLLPYLASASDFITTQLERGCVLVHCQGGISRSPTVVLGFLLHARRLRLPEAAEVLYIARPAVRPRAIFLADVAALALQLSEQADGQANATDSKLWADVVERIGSIDVASLVTADLSSPDAVRAECRRLVQQIGERCTTAVFGVPKPLLPDAEHEAREVVRCFAKSRNPTRRVVVQTQPSEAELGAIPVEASVGDTAGEFV